MIELRHKAIADGASVREAYDDFFQSHSLAMLDSYYLWILELLGVPRGSIMVDVACGNGRLVELAVRHNIYAIGIDLAYEGIAHVAASTPQAAWLCANGQTLPIPSASADYVVSSGSLEHYDDPLQGVRELARILKPTGQAYVLLPNSFGLWGNIRHVLKTGEVFDDAQPLQRYGTRGTWMQLLQQGGLKIEQVIGFHEVNRPRTLQDGFWMALHPQKLMRGTLGVLTPLNLANHFVFLCRRGEATMAGHYPTLPFA